MPTRAGPPAAGLAAVNQPLTGRVAVVQNGEHCGEREQYDEHCKQSDHGSAPVSKAAAADALQIAKAVALRDENAAAAAQAAELDAWKGIEKEVEHALIIGLLPRGNHPRFRPAYVPLLGRGILRAMPTYQRFGRLPRKRHIQFRENGTLLT